ncbi:hypothetical protein Q1695_013790 [Nippostrongylus brasiliensis]|nr:hypothetical protein Q1695_013790 [Nippostrongylus brasiliensis]
MWSNVNVEYQLDNKEKQTSAVIFEDLIGELFEKLDEKGASTATDDEKLDRFMRDTVVALRTHLFELEKVASLAENFYSKYSQALRRRMSHEVLVGASGDSDDELAEPVQNDELLSSALEQATVAILTTPQGTVSISLNPRTSLVCRPAISPSEEIT